MTLIMPTLTHCQDLLEKVKNSYKATAPNHFRTPRRSSSIFPPIDEDRATSGDESCKSVSGRTPSCASGHNCQHRGTLLRSSASSGVLRTRKSSDILQIPFPDHGTLVRTRSQEQVPCRMQLNVKLLVSCCIIWMQDFREI